MLQDAVRTTHHETKSLTLMLRVRQSRQVRSNAAAVRLFNYNYVCGLHFMLN